MASGCLVLLSRRGVRCRYRVGGPRFEVALYVVFLSANPAWTLFFFTRLPASDVTCRGMHSRRILVTESPWWSVQEDRVRGTNGGAVERSAEVCIPVWENCGCRGGGCNQQGRGNRRRRDVPAWMVAARDGPDGHELAVAPRSFVDQTLWAAVWSGWRVPQCCIECGSSSSHCESLTWKQARCPWPGVHASVRESGGQIVCVSRKWDRSVDGRTILERDMGAARLHPHPWVPP